MKVFRHVKRVALMSLNLNICHHANYRFFPNLILIRGREWIKYLLYLRPFIKKL
jgi:hypothetical protein